MLEKLKKYGIIGGSILGVLLLLAVSAYCYDLYKTKKNNTTQIAILTKEKANAEQAMDILKNSVNVHNKTKVVYKVIPGQPLNTPPQEFTLEASDTTGRWHFSYPPSVLSANTLLDSAVEPFKTALDSCLGTKNIKPKFWDTTQNVQIYLGYGSPSYQARIIYRPITLGGRGFSISPAIMVGGSMSTNNKTAFDVSGGIMIDSKFGGKR